MTLWKELATALQQPLLIHQQTSNLSLSHPLESSLSVSTKRCTPQKRNTLEFHRRKASKIQVTCMAVYKQQGIRATGSDIGSLNSSKGQGQRPHIFKQLRSKYSRT